MQQQINWDEFADDFAAASPEVKKEVTLELLPILARQRALAQPVAMELMCTVYRVGEAWEADMLAKESDVVSVTSFKMLQEMLQQQDPLSILITSQVEVTMEELRNEMRRCAYAKALFWYAG